MLRLTVDDLLRLSNAHNGEVRDETTRLLAGKGTEFGVDRTFDAMIILLQTLTDSF